MKSIENSRFEGERPLYASDGLHIVNVTFGEGESALKESKNLKAQDCLFEGRYPFWCCDNFEIKNCRFTEESRAPIWYSRNVKMKDCQALAPKILRELDEVWLERCVFPKAVETLWKCRDVKIKDCEFAAADYLLFGSSGISIEGMKLQGKYTFQYCRDVEIRNSVLDTKDAFWETDNVTVYDSVVKGEYLGWYSRGLTLVRCTISGTQPLCYAKNLKLIDCTMAPDADLAFEYSDVQATIIGDVASVKNPLSGSIHISGKYGEIILDENLKAPGDCEIA